MEKEITIEENKKTNFYIYGLKKGLPIALAYLAVSFAFGIMTKTGGISPLAATLMSFFSLTSAGQFAGSKLIMVVASYLEIFFTVLFINLRYALMSISLSQKIDSSIPRWKRIIMSFGITDEIYAVAITEKKEVNLKYMLGITTLPLIGWTLGTLIGSLGASIFSDNLLTAMNIALYAMFIAIIMPDSKKSIKITIVILIAIVISVVFYYVPYIKEIGFGFKIIIATGIACTMGALIFPKKEDEEQCM